MECTIKIIIKIPQMKYNTTSLYFNNPDLTNNKIKYKMQCHKTKVTKSS